MQTTMIETRVRTLPGWRTLLLLCGPLSSFLYVAMNVFIPMGFDGYSYSSHTVSELSAIEAPTRPLWVWLAVVYILLFAAFGWGVLQSSQKKEHLRRVGWIILVYCAFNIYWPPMHARGMQPTLTDTLHLVWASVTVILMMLLMGYGAAAFEKRFRIYTIVTIMSDVGFGLLTSLDAPKIPGNLPTPMLGVWERIMIGLFLLWVCVFAIKIVQKNRRELDKILPMN